MEEIITGFSEYKFGLPVEQLGVSRSSENRAHYENLQPIRLINCPAETLAVGCEKRSFAVVIGLLPNESAVCQVTLKLFAEADEYGRATESIELIGDRMVELLKEKYGGLTMARERAPDLKVTRLVDAEDNSITVTYDAEVVLVYYDSSSLNSALAERREEKRQEELETLAKL